MPSFDLYLSSPSLMFTLYPSCVHTTLAALLSQEPLQTLPHTPWMQTSTLPALSTGPSTKRTVPLVQGWAAMQGEMYCVCMCRWNHVPPIYYCTLYCIVLWQYSSPFVFISKGPNMLVVCPLHLCHNFLCSGVSVKVRLSIDN